MYQYSLQQKAPTSQVWKLLYTRTALDIFFGSFITQCEHDPVHELRMSSSHETDFSLANLKLVYGMITKKRNKPLKLKRKVDYQKKSLQYELLMFAQ